MISLPQRRALATEDTAVLLLLALLPALLLAPFLLGLKVLYYRDITLVFEPQIAFLRASLWSAQMPLWNPLVAGGLPQWASMEPPLLYPLTAIFFFVDFPRALALSLWLHMALAGGGAYALGRALGWRRPAALLSALSFGLGGFMISLSSLYTSLQAAALLPLLHLAYHRLCRRPGRRAWLIAAALLALQTAANRPEFTLMALLLLAAYGVVLGRREPRGAARNLLLLAGMAAAALLANAATVLPAAEFIRLSQRHGEVPLDEARAFSFAWRSALQLLFPQVYGSVEWGTDWGSRLIGEPGSSYSQLYLTYYGGMGAYLLALYALGRGRRPFVWLAAGLATFALLMALGRGTPLFRLFHYLPIFALVRYPVKYFLIWSWATALLAGAGADAWLRRPEAARSYFRICLAAGVLGSMAVSASGPALLSAWLVPLACLCLLAALGSVGRKGWLFALAAALDLMIQARPFIYGAAPDFYTAPVPAAVYLAARSAVDQPFRLHHFLKENPEGTRGYADLPQFLHWSPAGGQSWQEALYRWARQLLPALTPIDYGLAGTQPSPSSLTPFYSIHYLLGAVLDTQPASDREPGPLQVAGLMNVRYLRFVNIPARPASPWAADRQQLRLAFSDPGSGLLLYENLAWTPPVRFCNTALVVTARDEAYRKLVAAPEPGRVVLQDGPELQATLRVRGTHLQRLAGVVPRCRLLAYRNQLVQVAVDTPESGFLTLADNHYPGWEATVDGEPRPILIADAVNRAVWVQAGRHEVEFRYRPGSWSLGVLLSLLTLQLGLLAILTQPRQAAFSIAREQPIV